MVKFSKIDKQLNKELKQSIRSAAKRLKLKSRSERFFDKVGDYLVKYMIDIDFPDNEFRLIIRPYIKPYIIDDIFWEVFDMASNSQAPMSLRAVGAFTVDKFFLPDKIATEDWTIEDLDLERLKPRFSKCSQRPMKKSLNLSVASLILKIFILMWSRMRQFLPIMT